MDPRARRLILRLTSDGVRVTCPSRRHLRDAVRLAEARRSWVAERLAERPEAVPLAVGRTLTVFGDALRIVPAPSPRAAARIAGGEIVAGGADEAAVARRVEALLRRVARERMAATADGHAARLGLPPCPVTVRQMSSRWGSCSARPSISLDWRLCLAPPEVAGYVCAHETAHRVHMDHSPAFWAEVARLVPGYREHDRWLREHGRSLHAYGR